MKRPGVTLVEVLVAIFVMAIGMMAILTLFPLGAMSMAEALKNDRCGTAANTAAAIANARDVRTDMTVRQNMWGITDADITSPATVPAGFATPSADGPGYPLLVDPFGAQGGYGTLGASPPTPGIARCSTSFVGGSPALAARWFSVLDDMVFDPNGVPPGGGLNRPGRYTWSYLVRRPRASMPSMVDLWVVVFYNRPTSIVDGENGFAAAGAVNDLALTLGWNSPTDKPAVRRNTWVLDVTFDPTNLVHGDFYRVVSATESGATTVCELETPLKKPGTGAALNQYQFVVLEYVAEVFYKGAGTLPN